MALSGRISPTRPHTQNQAGLWASNNNDDDQNDDKLFQESAAGELDAEALEEMERDQPSEWMIMKEVSAKLGTSGQRFPASIIKYSNSHLWCP